MNLQPYSFPSPNGGLVLSSGKTANGNMAGATAQLLFLAPQLLTAAEVSSYSFGLYNFDKNSFKGNLTADFSHFIPLQIDDAISRLLFLAPPLLTSPEASSYSSRLCNFYKSAGNYTADFGHFLPIQIDDAIALASLFEYGRSYAMYKNGEFTWLKPAFLIKLQGFWQHLKISAKISVGPMGRLIWIISILLAARQPFSSQDSWLESAMMILVKKRRGWKSFFGDLAVEYWLQKKGKMTMASIYQSYCGFEDHPLVECWNAVEKELVL